MKQPTLTMKKNRGVTLTEVMVVVAIIGILAAIAVPSYQDMIERNRLKQAAESLKSDLQFTRTEAIKGSSNVTLDFTGVCYGISPGGACDCGTAGSCTIKTVDTSQFTGITLAGNDVTFSFRRGTTTDPGTISSTLSSTNYAVTVETTLVGRVRICPSIGSLGYQC
ncbi:MAG: GspH/FimT family pseudopilin [Methylobacter sp.]|nr:GspH/FimT family pseudopilin [Methylobacter sp.]